MRCPGQDRRYWQGDAAFEVPCPECGTQVEFFKDETSARCPRCGHRFQNPGIDFGCAQWCALAEQCLGFVPEREVTAGAKEGALAGRLIQEAQKVFQGATTKLTHTLKVYHYAKDFVAKEGGDPRVVLAAALLLHVDKPRAEGRDNAPQQGAADAESILGRHGVDDETIRKVSAIVNSHASGRELDQVEFRIVSDADALAAVTDDGPGEQIPRRLQVLTTQLKTAAARQWAEKLFQAFPPQPEGDHPRDQRR